MTQYLVVARTPTALVPVRVCETEMGAAAVARSVTGAYVRGRCRALFGLACGPVEATGYVTVVAGAMQSFTAVKRSSHVSVTA